PLEIEFVKDGYIYRLSYPELKALHMSGYAEFSLLMNTLLEGFAIFVIIIGGLRLIWSGLHLYTFWDHVQPYFRSEHVRSKAKYRTELTYQLAKKEEIKKEERGKVKKELETKEEIIASQSSEIAGLVEGTEGLRSEADKLKERLKGKETQAYTIFYEKKELESRLKELEKDLKDKVNLSKSMEAELNILRESIQGAIDDKMDKNLAYYTDKISTFKAKVEELESTLDVKEKTISVQKDMLVEKERIVASKDSKNKKK
ncbi:MAG: hypothetical protein ACE5J5_05905, partial [Candidatus Hydrothermarchaeales archaeon]